MALQVNQPQLRVTINGTVVPGAVSAEIERVAYFVADRFALTFALGAGPGFNREFFTSVGLQVLTIEVSSQQSGYTQILTGQVDGIRDNLAQNLVTLTGRDLSARLIDTEISETFANQTSSQVAATICSRHSLTANITTTSTPIGQYYDLDHARSALGLNSRGGTEWNLLSWLAIVEGFTLSVYGTTLNFGLPLAGQTFDLTPEGCSSLSIDTLCALPKTTMVKSWNTRNKLVVTQSSGGGAGLETTLIRPNLTSQQASKLVQNHQSMLDTHEVILIATMPGELSLVPGAMINLSGTNSPYDQDYLVDTITRSISSVAGFTQHVRAHGLS